MKIMKHKNTKRRRDILESAVLSNDDDEDLKLSLSACIIEYNLHMNKLDDNAQQRTYYSIHRSDNRY